MPALRAFLLIGGPAVDGDGVTRASASGLLLDSAGVPQPSPFNPDVLGYSNGFEIHYSDTYLSIRQRAEAQLRALFTQTVQIVWLDAKGLL